jgi:hypothetical protein
LVQPDVQPGVIDRVGYRPRFSNLIADGKTSNSLVRSLF